MIYGVYHLTMEYGVYFSTLSTPNTIHHSRITDCLPLDLDPLPRGVNPGGWGSRPQDFGLGSWGRGQVSENTIAYFAQKVC